MEKMSEDVQKASEERKKDEEKKKKEEEEKYKAMSSKEYKDVDDHKKADEIKAKGNEEFKKKNFDEAIKLYQQAIDIYPKEMVYYLNSAKCYLEKKDYDKAIELCKHVCENSRDFTRRATAFGIQGYAYRAQNKLDEALKAFEDSQMEKNDVRIKEALKETTLLKKKQEAEAYINPDIAEEENKKANDLYKAGKFPEALKVYEEAIKRNPKLPKYYTNRAQCYIKLMEFYQAIKDCESAIKIDPKTLKAYQKKANCHFITKEYHKVLQTIDDGLKHFPDDQELKQLRDKTILAINMGTGEDDQERQRKAAADPEIQALLRDPRIQQLFKDFKENPASAQQAIMKDEYIRNAFQKLVAAGIVKTK
jgi:stress-induced-phosphoprotein 1